MARKLRSENGRIVQNRTVECRRCGVLVLESELEDHDCPDA